jgi:two-component system osmolarity sensor histidine kinase EnvZ
MRKHLQVFAGIRSGLFWRTFFLLSFLITSSMAAWFISFKLVERKPRAQQQAGQIISLVTITRAALTHSAEDKRRELLLDLARNEGIRIYLLEESDKIEAQVDNVFFAELRTLVQKKLGTTTQFAREVNGEEGFWLSFAIDEDQYWLRLEQDRLQNETGTQIVGWASVTLILTLIGAVFISRRINAPLSNLSHAARQLAHGRRPKELPEDGPSEIRETNASFNQMVDDLARGESDRAVILAGISHDLRTPLTRLQLELEMAALDSTIRDAMQSDLTQMDGIIQQFLDYAKPLHESTFNNVNLTAVAEKTILDLQRDISIKLTTQIDAGIFITGIEIEIQRLLNNLIQNAIRYARNPQTGQVHLEFECRYLEHPTSPFSIIRLRDFGPGVPTEEIDRLLRPFTRGEIARSQANGSGLGLAIVDRIVKRHGGKIRLQNHKEGGLEIEIRLTAQRISKK